MGTHGFVRLRRLGTAAGLAALLGLSSKPGWGEEFGPSAPEAAPSVDDPWPIEFDPGIPLATGREPDCSPWTSTAQCRGEAELLLDPWADEVPPRPCAPPRADPAPGTLADVSEPAESTPELPPEPPPLLPTAAEVWAERQDGELAAAAPNAGPSSTLDSWITDPGVPEAPFE